MVDLQSQYKKIKHEVDKSVIGIMEEATFINGPIVKAFQKNLEEYLQVKHVIPCANGTDSLQIACLLYTSPSPRDQRGSRMPSSA